MRAFVLMLLAAGSPVAADVFPFRTPSGNINCTVGTGDGPSDIECSIVERSGEPAAPRPAGCAGPWGHRFAMRASGRVEMSCGAPGAPHTAPGAGVAEYGVTGTFGGITCLSSQSGLECRNADGHGFFLSRKRQSVF